MTLRFGTDGVRGPAGAELDGITQQVDQYLTQFAVVSIKRDLLFGLNNNLMSQSLFLHQRLQ